MVESQPSKLLVAGSIPVSRSSLRSRDTRVSFGSASRATRRLSRRSAKREGGRLTLSTKREHVPKADVAQLAERVLGKDEVTGSILVIGSNRREAPM